MLNKIDLLLRAAGVRPRRPARRTRVRALVRDGRGVEEFRRALFELVPAAAPSRWTERRLADFLVYRPEPRARPYRIFRTDRGYRVTGTPPEEELEEAQGRRRAHGRRGRDRRRGLRARVTGLYGGTFDPPHNGHVALVRAALDHFELDRLVVLVAGGPGHKPPVARCGSRACGWRRPPFPISRSSSIHTRARRHAAGAAVGRPDLPRRRGPARRVPRGRSPRSARARAAGVVARRGLADALRSRRRSGRVLRDPAVDVSSTRDQATRGARGADRRPRPTGRSGAHRRDSASTGSLTGATLISTSQGI